MRNVVSASLISCFLIFCGLASAANKPVLLELFTSEGCSSCPPADRLLEKLDAQQPFPGAELIVLSEHVDYWNQLGWADPYSSAAWSQRQRDYSRRLRGDVYTPQLVVDGHAGLVGNQANEVQSAIREALQQEKIPVTVTATRNGDQASIGWDAPGANGHYAVFIALAYDHAQSQVSSGENGGRKLSHVAVVYSLKKADLKNKTATLPLKGQSSRVIVFVQDTDSGKILGAAQAKI